MGKSTQYVMFMIGVAALVLAMLVVTTTPVRAVNGPSPVAVVNTPTVKVDGPAQERISLTAGTTSAYLRRLHTDATVETDDFVVPAGHVLLIRDIMANAPNTTGSLTCLSLHNEGGIPTAQFRACESPVSVGVGIAEHLSAGVEFEEGSRVFANTIGATSVEVIVYGVLIATQ